VPITHAQKLLGHSTVEMTARVYTHLDEHNMRDAINQIGSTGTRNQARAVGA
jgi:integrase